MDGMDAEKMVQMTTHDKHPDYASIQSGENSAFTSLDVEDPMQPHAKPMLYDHYNGKSLSGSSSSSDPFDLMQSQCGPFNDQELWWKATHAFGFFMGGTTFIAGTACYFFPSWEAGGLIAGILYTIGSFGFLYVDVLEYFTYTGEPWLRTNISCSAFGSLLYVVGSIGFIPSVYAITVWIGEYGFIFGSFFIGCSQTWKVCRLSQEEGGPCGTLNTMTAIGVEAGAGFGGWFFFVGTIMYAHGPLVGEFYNDVLWTWTYGSIAFTIGSLFLTYRHFVMGL